MEIEFYRIPGWDCWFTISSPYTVFEWAQEHNIKYKTDHHIVSMLGISLLDDHSKIYFELKWGGNLRKVVEV